MNPHVPSSIPFRPISVGYSGREGTSHYKLLCCTWTHILIRASHYQLPNGEDQNNDEHSLQFTPRGFCLFAGCPAETILAFLSVIKINSRLTHPARDKKLMHGVCWVVRSVREKGRCGVMQNFGDTWIGGSSSDIMRMLYRTRRQKR